MDISRRYTFLNGNGKNTTDCTIKITEFNHFDDGRWSCETFVNENNGALHSTNVRLSLRGKQTLTSCR